MGKDQLYGGMAAFRLRARKRFFYEYDFYGHWVHEIRVEQLLPLDPAGIYPLCTDGARAVPVGWMRCAYPPYVLGGMQ